MVDKPNQCLQDSDKTRIGPQPLDQVTDIGIIFLTYGAVLAPLANETSGYHGSLAMLHHVTLDSKQNVE
jgi:hypothetical protein